MLNALYRSATRHLVKNRVAAILNISGIAIGVATCLLILIWAQREASFDDFHPDVNRKFRLWNTFKSESETFSQAASGIALGARLPEHVPAIVSACRIFNNVSKFKFEDKTFFEQHAIIADSSFFSFFGFKLLKGQAEQLLRSPNDIVMSEATAIRYFGSVNAAMDKIVLMDDKPMRVAGVAANAPLNSHIQFDIVVPYKWLHSFALEDWKEDIDNAWVGGWPHTYVEIAETANPEQAEKQVNDVVARFSKKEWQDNKMSYQYFMMPVKDIHLKSSLRYDSANKGSLTTLRIFVTVAIFILLLACINYINLSTATALQRAKEISLRKVVGASRQQLMRQFFVETLVIAVISVGIALVVLELVLPAFSSWIGQPYYFSFNMTNIGALAAFIVIVTVLSGFYPSVILSGFKPVTAVKGSFSHSHGGQLARKSLVILQFTISTVLLVSVLTVHDQMKFIQQKPLGYSSDAIITVDYNGDESVYKKYQTIRNELLSVPYVVAVTRHSANVVGGLGNGWITTENKQGGEVTTSIYRMGIDAEYFDTYGMTLVAGRTFEKGTADSSKSVLVNEAAVRMLGWSMQDAIGKRFGKGDEAKDVIGVVRDFHFESLHKLVEPLLISHVGTGRSISLRIEGTHLTEGLTHLKNVWANQGVDIPLQYAFVDDTVGSQYAQEQKMESIFYVFAGLSFLIACMGLFGLSTFMMQQRIREIGIRKVLGAEVTTIVMLLTTDFSKLVLLSAVIAVPIGWYAMQAWLQSFAYRTQIGWWIYVIAIVTPVLIALLTVSIQSVKAALMNPAKTLRTE